MEFHYLTKQFGKLDPSLLCGILTTTPSEGCAGAQTQVHTRTSALDLQTYGLMMASFLPLWDNLPPQLISFPIQAHPMNSCSRHLADFRRSCGLLQKVTSKALPQGHPSHLSAPLEYPADNQSWRKLHNSTDWGHWKSLSPGHLSKSSWSPVSHLCLKRLLAHSHRSLPTISLIKWGCWEKNPLNFLHLCSALCPAFCLHGQVILQKPSWEFSCQF